MNPPASETLAFRSTEGTFLNGRLTLFRRSVTPVETAWGRLLLVHGYGEHSGRYRHFYYWMAERGVACHAVDLRGQGRSSGRRGYVRHWYEYVDDLHATLQQEFVAGPGPLFILGHSHGGLVVTAAVLQGLNAARGYILSAPYFRSRVAVSRVKQWAGRALNPICPALCIPSGLDPGWMTSDPAMREDSRTDPLLVATATPRWYCGSMAAQAEVMRRCREFRQPFLALIGDADPVSDPDAVHEFYAGAGAQDKTERIYPQLLHEILREADRERVFQDILDWMREHTR